MTQTTTDTIHPEDFARAPETYGTLMALVQLVERTRLTMASAGDGEAAEALGGISDQITELAGRRYLGIDGDVRVARHIAAGPARDTYEAAAHAHGTAVLAEALRGVLAARGLPSIDIDPIEDAALDAQEAAQRLVSR